MKILLSAFACAPNVGSEGGVGWRWALELAKEHEVVVLTDIYRRSFIEPVVQSQDITNPRIIYYRAEWVRKLPLNSSRAAQTLYSLWQYSLLPFAYKLHKEHQFDLAIHLTYGVFRHPSFLGFLGIPFVFGPAGGGEDAPWRLKRSFPFKDKVFEVLRAVLNLCAKFNPFLWLSLSRASLILVKTAETARALPPPYVKKAIELQEIGITQLPQGVQSHPRKEGEALKVLFAGRLISLKGIHLALRAVAKARSLGGNIEFTIIGSGSRHTWLKRLANELKLSESVLQWKEQIPQDQLFDIYAQSHCLLFPSLRDSSGNVVLEAISFGLPVICLDLGGPPTLVDEHCATVVSTKGCSEAEVVAGLAHALLEIEHNEKKRLAMSQAALYRSKDMTWDKRVAEAMELIKAHCFT